MMLGRVSYLCSSAVVRARFGSNSPFVESNVDGSGHINWSERDAD